MEYLTSIDLVSMGYVGAITFGLTWIVDLLIPQVLTSKQKFLLSVIIAIAVSFVPADMGNFIVNKLRDGLAVASAIAGVYQFSAKVAEKV